MTILADFVVFCTLPVPLDVFVKTQLIPQHSSWFFSKHSYGFCEISHTNFWICKTRTCFTVDTSFNINCLMYEPRLKVFNPIQDEGQKYILLVSPL